MRRVTYLASCPSCARIVWWTGVADSDGVVSVSYSCHQCETSKKLVRV